MEIGFGKAARGHTAERLLNRDGTFNVEKRGIRRVDEMGFYQALFAMSWPRFMFSVFSAFLFGNIVFAMLYSLCGPHALFVEPNARLSNHFLQCFFFSVQTSTTIGYGVMYPVGVTANILVMFEALLGLLEFALFTGFFFARVSRPNAKVLFSDVALIAPYQGKQSFQYRMVNKRSEQLLEARVRVVYTQVVSSGGVDAREYHRLPLLISEVMFFPVYWTVTHVIDETSPLFGLSMEELTKRKAEVLILFSAVDESFAETVYLRRSYRYDEMRFGTFESMYIDVTSGAPAIDVTKLSTFTPTEISTAAAA